MSLRVATFSVLCSITLSINVWAQDVVSVASDVNGTCLLFDDHVQCLRTWTNNSSDNPWIEEISNLAATQLDRATEIAVRPDLHGFRRDYTRVCVTDSEGLKCESVPATKGIKAQDLPQPPQVIATAQPHSLSMHGYFGACALSNGVAVCDQAAARWLGKALAGVLNIDALTVSATAYLEGVSSSDRPYGCVLVGDQVTCHSTKRWGKGTYGEIDDSDFFSIAITGLNQPRQLVSGDFSEFKRHCVLDQDQVKCWKNLGTEYAARPLNLTDVRNPYLIATDGFMGCVASAGLALKSRISCWSWDRHGRDEFKVKHQEFAGMVRNFAAGSPFCAIVEGAESGTVSVQCFPDIVKYFFHKGPLYDYEQYRVARLFWDKALPIFQPWQLR